MEPINVPTDFDRFLDVENIIVASQRGLLFGLTFYNPHNHSTKPSNEDDEPESEPSEYVIDCWTKEYKEDKDCSCKMIEDFEDGYCDDTCCNWNHEVKVKDATASGCILKMIKAINDVVYCQTCGRAHNNGEEGKCASCFLQHFVEPNLPIVGECTVCTECFTKPLERRLYCCQNNMCQRCFRNLKDPKACPFCRCRQ